MVYIDDGRHPTRPKEDRRSRLSLNMSDGTRLSCVNGRARAPLSAFQPETGCPDRAFDWEMRLGDDESDRACSGLNEWDGRFVSFPCVPDIYLTMLATRLRTALPSLRQRLYSIRTYTSSRDPGHPHLYYHHLRTTPPLLGLSFLPDVPPKGAESRTILGFLPAGDNVGLDDFRENAPFRRVRPPLGRKRHGVLIANVLVYPSDSYYTKL